MRRTIIRRLYNSGEPVNEVEIYFELDNPEKPEFWHPIELSGHLQFRDGRNRVYVGQGDGGFEWINDGKTGIEPTFDAAVRHLPALVTHPDHFEDIPVQMTVAILDLGLTDEPDN